MDPRAVARELTGSVHALEADPGFPAGYVERARTAAAGLSPIEVPEDEVPTDEVTAAARQLHAHAGAGVEVQVEARSPVIRAGALAAHRLVHWYLGFLGHRADQLGRTAARFGEAVTHRLAGLEAGQAATRRALETQATALGARLAELEVRLGPVRPEDPAGSGPAGL